MHYVEFDDFDEEVEESVDPALATKAFAGRKMSQKMFSKDQRAFYAKHAPEGVELGDLVMLGPVNIMKLKFTPAALRRKMVADRIPIDRHTLLCRAHIDRLRWHVQRPTG